MHPLSCSPNSDSNKCLQLKRPPSNGPIRVAPKPKRRKRRPNVFLDDRGYPDQSDEFDHILHNIDGKPVLRKRKHPAPPLDAIDPEFNCQFDESKHGALLRETLDVSHLKPDVAKRLVALVKKYWPVFSPEGRFVPVKDYEFSIDTGTAAPISVKKINYGARETPRRKQPWR